MDNLKTGDLVLFCGHSDGWMQYFSDMIKYGTHSNYSHVGMIIKDPKFIDPALKVWCGVVWLKPHTCLFGVLKQNFCVLFKSHTY